MMSGNEGGCDRRFRYGWTLISDIDCDVMMPDKPEVPTGSLRNDGIILRRPGILFWLSVSVTNGCIWVCDKGMNDLTEVLKKCGRCWYQSEPLPPLLIRLFVRPPKTWVWKQRMGLEKVERKIYHRLLLYVSTLKCRSEARQNFVHSECMRVFYDLQVSRRPRLMAEHSWTRASAERLSRKPQGKIRVEWPVTRDARPWRPEFPGPSRWCGSCV